ncbi:PIN-like domain-containing protein, partial [Peribacillus simplex]
EIHKPLDEYEDKFKQKDFYDKGKLKETDIIVEAIAKIYTQKIGNKHSRNETISFYKEGDFRFSKLVPPGFEDIDKNDYRIYGDYIIWEEMMKIAKQEKKPIIFVTGDLKNDWWYIDNNKEETRKPLSYLLKEFKDETDQYFYMYTYGTFIEKAKERYSTLPSTENVTKEMSFLISKDQSSVENDSYVIHLQNLLNHSNSAIANKAYQDLNRYRSLNLSEDEYLIRQVFQYVSQFGPSNIKWAQSLFNEIRLNENLTPIEKTQAIKDLYQKIMIKTDFGY